MQVQAQQRDSASGAHDMNQTGTRPSPCGGARNGLDANVAATQTRASSAVSRPHALNTMENTQGSAKCLSDRHVSCSSVYLRVLLWCAALVPVIFSTLLIASSDGASSFTPPSLNGRSHKVTDAAALTSLLSRNLAQLFATSSTSPAPFTVLHYDPARHEALLRCDTQEQEARVRAAAGLGGREDEPTLSVVSSSPFLAALGSTV